MVCWCEETRKIFAFKKSVVGLVLTTTQAVSRSGKGYVPWFLTEGPVLQGFWGVGPTNVNNNLWVDQQKWIKMLRGQFVQKMVLSWPPKQELTDAYSTNHCANKTSCLSFRGIKLLTVVWDEVEKWSFSVKEHKWRNRKSVIWKWWGTEMNWTFRVAYRQGDFITQNAGVLWISECNETVRRRAMQKTKTYIDKQRGLSKGIEIVQKSILDVCSANIVQLIPWSKWWRGQSCTWVSCMEYQYKCMDR